MAKVTKKEITTDSGFKIKIDPNIGDDMELIEAIQAIAAGKPNAMPMADVVERMLGESGKMALYEYCRDETTGRVKASVVTAEIDNIFLKAVEILKKA